MYLFTVKDCQGNWYVRFMYFLSIVQKEYARSLILYMHARMFVIFGMVYFLKGDTSSSSEVINLFWLVSVFTLFLYMFFIYAGGFWKVFMYLFTVNPGHVENSFRFITCIHVYILGQMNIGDSIVLIMTFFNEGY